MVTDPPYGVNYDATVAIQDSVSAQGSEATGKSTNDDKADWQAAYALFPGAGSLTSGWQGSPFRWRPAGSTPADSSPTLTHHLGQGAHRASAEVTTTGDTSHAGMPSRKGAKANWTGDRKASTLWEIDNTRKSETGHSAQKPVECYAAGHPQPQG